MSKTTAEQTTVDYGVDAPGVMRNLFLFGALALILSFVIPASFHTGRVEWNFQVPLRWTAGILLLQALMFLRYVKSGKFLHRDQMLELHMWDGSEQVLDVGCGRGLLLAGAAKKLTTGSATGLDIWSQKDMGANSEAATRRNLEIEGVAGKCTLVSEPAQAMPFPDGSFDVVLSNLCLHNIEDKQLRKKAINEIARVLKPEGVALISDYKYTGDYAKLFDTLDMDVERQWGSVWTTFPPLRIVIAHKLKHDE